MLGIAEWSFLKGTTALPFGQWQSLAPVTDLKKKNCLFLPSSSLILPKTYFQHNRQKSFLLNGGLNPPLPPSKGNQIGCSGSGQKSKANYLPKSIIPMVFIVSFKTPAAASFLALNLCCQQSPEQRFTSFHRYHVEWGEFCTFTLSKARLSPVLGCSSSNPWAKAIIKPGSAMSSKKPHSMPPWISCCF